MEEEKKGGVKEQGEEKGEKEEEEQEKEEEQEEGRGVMRGEGFSYFIFKSRGGRRK